MDNLRVILLAALALALALAHGVAAAESLVERTQISRPSAQSAVERTDQSRVGTNNESRLSDYLESRMASVSPRMRPLWDSNSSMTVRVGRVSRF